MAEIENETRWKFWIILVQHRTDCLEIIRRAECRGHHVELFPNGRISAYGFRVSADEFDELLEIRRQYMAGEFVLSEEKSPSVQAEAQEN